MGTIWIEGQFKNSAKPVKIVGGSGIDPDTLKKYTSVLYDQSLLAQGLSIDDPKEYAKSITELMMK